MCIRDRPRPITSSSAPVPPDACWPAASLKILVPRWRCWKQAGPDCRSDSDDDLDPVSYTHLDVYKRQTEADYVIVGAGSAGCVLAGRLSEDPGAEVAVLEAGGPRLPFGQRRRPRSCLLYTSRCV